MQKVKKLTALVLAMMMALSIMAVTASAYGAEEHEHVCSEDTIQPRGPGMSCPVCLNPMKEIKTATDSKGRYTEFQCDYYGCTYRTHEKVYW